MPKLTEYPQASSFDANDILIKDGVNGTKKITIEDFVNYVVDSSPFKNHGFLENTDNLDNITEMGTYTFRGNDASKPAGYPAEMIGADRSGMLIVFASASTTYNIIEQFIIIPSIGTTIESGGTTIQAANTNMILYRHRSGSNPITWYSWTSVSISRTLLAADNLDDILHTGDYRCQTSLLPVNAPVSEGGLLMVRAPVRDMVSQIYITVNSGIYYRVRTSAGWNNWTKLYVSTTSASIPVLALTGDTTGMSKANAVTMNYTFFNRSGTCTVKWQGSSSLRYAKKNYTITLDEKMDANVNYLAFRREMLRHLGFSGGYGYSQYEFSTKNTYAKGTNVYYKGNFYQFNSNTPHEPGPWNPSEVTPITATLSGRPWGDQRKFCAKANWVDPSATRNVSNAKLWGQMVKARIDAKEIGDIRMESPNYGAIDGFPIEITINGASVGLYTFNIPKDAWTFSMFGVSKYDSKWYYEVGDYVKKDNVLYRCNTEIVGGETWTPGHWDQVTAYDTSASYSVGDYTINNGSLYRCNTAISGGEAWNSDHWDHVVEYVLGGENNASPACTWNDNMERTGPTIDWSTAEFPEYDETSHYVVGDYVFWDDTLHRCKVNTPVPAGSPSANGDLSTTYWEAMFAVEHNTDGTTDYDALGSFDAALTIAKTAGSDWENALAACMDINSIFDYFIFTLCIANNDALARNILYGSYDGAKWFMSAYDLDTSNGFDPYGVNVFEVKGDRTNFASAASFNKLVNLMYTHSKAKLKARYKLWREGGYSGSELTGWTTFDGSVPEGRKYMKTNVDIGEVVTEQTGSSAVHYVKVACSPGDTFTIVTKGGTASRAWAFVNSENRLLSVADNSTTISTPTTFVAPANAAYFIVNDITGTGYGYSGAYFPPVLSDENVWHTYTLFGKDIPSIAYNADRMTWPTAQDTSIATIPQFMDYYRMHCKYLDAEIEALS